jgi:DNA polymerase elongation subunit (family B)
MTAQKDSESNGVKVTLNSGFGIFARANWNYGNALIANSITNAGKIYGIKLFQQIASNILTEEQKLFEKID